jgi:hypothetical protein
MTKRGLQIVFAAVLLSGWVVLSAFAECQVYLGPGSCTLVYPGTQTDGCTTIPTTVGCTQPHGGHPTSNAVAYEGMLDQIDDQGGWTYYYRPEDPRYGTIVVNCGHLNRRSRPWVNE